MFINCILKFLWPFRFHTNHMIGNKTGKLFLWNICLCSGESRISPRWGRQPSRGRQHMIFAKFPNTAWNWKNLEPWGARPSSPPLDQPLLCYDVFTVTSGWMFPGVCEGSTCFRFHKRLRCRSGVTPNWRPRQQREMYKRNTRRSNPSSWHRVSDERWVTLPNPRGERTMAGLHVLGKFSFLGNIS